MITVLGPRMLQQPWLLVSLATYAVVAVIAFVVQRPGAAHAPGAGRHPDRRRPRRVAGPRAAAALRRVRAHVGGRPDRVPDVDEAAAVVTRAGSAPRSAAIVNLGCKVNQSEMEGAARLLREAGVPLVDPDRGADLVPRQHLHRHRHRRREVARGRPPRPPRQPRRRDRRHRLLGPGRAGGVRADRRRRAARRQRGQGRVPRRARGAAGDRRARAPRRRPGAEPGRCRRSRAWRRAIDGIADDRASVERTRAFVKVQDGCSFYCTYCIIPQARGAERSLAPEAVLADVRRALGAGHREIVLTGINIGTYDGGWSERGHRGAHTRSALTLAGLVRRILAETDDRADPPELDRAPARRRRAARGLGRRRAAHAAAPPPAAPVGRRRRPAPHGPPVPDRRLRARSSSEPGRRSPASPSTPTSSRASRPRTTRRSRRTIAFVRAMDLAGLHVFRYSARPGTPATRMAGQVDERDEEGARGRAAGDGRGGARERSRGGASGR